MNPRTCIVSREEKSPDEMIRFVKGPENRVYPDLQRKLPGRGVWVSATQKDLEHAIAKGLFARGFKEKVEVDDNLPVLVSGLMRTSALQALAMAKKAGLLVTGQAKAEAAIRDDAAVALIQAGDAGSDGVKKLQSAIKAQQIYEGHEIKRIDEFSSEELDQALNGTNTAYVALLKGGATQKLMQMIDRLTNYKAGRA